MSIFKVFLLWFFVLMYLGCSSATSLYKRLFGPDPVDNIAARAISPTEVELSWRNPTTEDFKETILSWTSSQGVSGSETPRPGAPGSSDEITLELEPDEYTFTLTAVDTEGDTSLPRGSAPIYVGPLCHQNNPESSSLRNRDFSSGFNLSAFDGSATADGFRSLGEMATDFAGTSIASGDINGDGIDDVLIGASGAAGGIGAGYVIFGKDKENERMNLVLSSNLSDGFTITGSTGGLPDTLGSSISSGDINGDGIDDVLIGATGVGLDDGAGYVIFGKREEPAAFNDITLTDTGDFGLGNDSNGMDTGFRILGAAMFNTLGSSISSGDINGDGIDDVLIGAQSITGSGAGYVIFGSTSPDDIDLSEMTTTEPDFFSPDKGFTITAAGTNDKLGSSISSGDINGDGIDDVLIGASFGEVGDQGTGYVIFGSDDPGDIDFSETTTTEPDFFSSDKGFTITGVGTGDQLGFSISSGDINGDGIDDVLIGATGVDISGFSDIGAGYIIFGSTSPGDITLTNNGAPGNDFGLPIIDGVDTGFRIVGTGVGDQLGYSLSSGDINSDGIQDVLIGAFNADINPASVTTNEGVGYVIFGGNGNNINLNLSSSSPPYVPDNTGFRIVGAAGMDFAGYSLSSGDINNDGIQDVLIGARRVMNGGNNNAGAGYTLLGACQPP